MQLNKQGTLSCKNVLSLHKRHWSSCNRGSVASQQVTRMFSSKTPRCNSLEACACTLLIYLPTLCISITFVTSLNDDHDCLLPSSMAWKPCTCDRRAMPAHLCTCWHPFQVIFLKLCMDHLVNSISWILSLWHSPPGISVQPHTGA